MFLLFVAIHWNFLILYPRLKKKCCLCVFRLPGQVDDGSPYWHGGEPHLPTAQSTGVYGPTKCLRKPPHNAQADLGLPWFFGCFKEDFLIHFRALFAGRLYVMFLTKLNSVGPDQIVIWVKQSTLFTAALVTIAVFVVTKVTICFGSNREQCMLGLPCFLVHLLWHEKLYWLYWYM